MKKLFIFFLLGIILINFTSAVCTLTFDKTDYVATEIITAAMSCSTPQERNQIYSVNWTNSSGALIHQDNGTTPSPATGQTFYEDYVLPSTYTGEINATLSGTNLEGGDTANVTSLSVPSNENILVIVNSSFGGGYIGRVGSIQATVKEENGRKISGGRCMISGWSNDETEMILEKETFIVDGDVKTSAIIPAERFEEGVQYAYKILCYCGGIGSGTECIDSLGNSINNSVGNTKGSFEIKTWLEVNTVVDKSIYQLKDGLFICANVTNVNYSKRLPMHIYNKVRCSAGKDNDYDTDRSLIYEDKHDNFDMRGISTNTTQMQCKKIIIPEYPYLQGRNSECYASTNVWVLNEVHEEIFEYSTTSLVFNITSDELNLVPDWQWTSNNTLNSIVNLSSSSFDDYNGTGIGNIDLQLHSEKEELDIIHALNIFNSLSNVIVKNSTSTLTRHVDYEIEFTEEDNIEIELRNMNLSKTSGVGWWNITLDFYNLDLRQTIALEGVENKTGTFHLDVDCPAIVDKGTTMNCSIGAQVEDSQVVEKEVDFTCYITDGTNNYSSLNFNQMVNRSLITLYREFLVPPSFIDGAQYVLQCHADYYNFGSRRDSFYDTFTTSGIIPTDEFDTSSGRYGDGGIAPITGSTIIGEEEKSDEEEIPFVPDEKEEIFLLLILIFIVSFMILILLKKKRIHYRNFKPNKLKLNHFRILIGIIISTILIFFVVNFLYRVVDNLVSYSFSQDPLFRNIIFIGFLVGMVILLFKTLNIRGEIKFGEDLQSRRYYYDKKTSKLQNRINQEVLKHELKRTKQGKY